MKSRENPRCNIPESQSCDISGNTRKNTFGDKVTSCLEHNYVCHRFNHGATMVQLMTWYALGNDAFTHVCVLASYADTSSDRLCGHTPIHTEKIRSSV